MQSGWAGNRNNEKREKMKKVLFVIPYLVEGGAERALSNITTHFPSEWHIDILVNDDTVVDYSYKGTVLTLGFTGKMKTDSVLFQFRVLLRRVRRLRNLKKNGDYQACVSFLDSANIANILSGRRYCRTVLSVRISLRQAVIRPQYKYVVNPLAKALYGFADKIVAVSAGIEEELITDFGLKKQNIVTIENGYNTEEIQLQCEEKLSDQQEKLLYGKKVVATTGRMSLPKGQWHLIRAFSEVVKKIPNALLMIIGSGELENHLKALSVSYGLEDQVYFTGHAANPYKYLNRADIFVLPSLYEGFPNALAEAMCMGLPCIATDFRTGARELLAPNMDLNGERVRCVTEVQYGMLTPICSGKLYGDVDEPLEQSEQFLADAVCSLLLDEDKQKVYSGKSRLRGESLKIEQVVDKWLDIIGESRYKRF